MQSYKEGPSFLPTLKIVEANDHRKVVGGI